MTRADYIRLRNRYLPSKRKIVLVLESPPKSGRYFYNPDSSVLEPLFRAMMKDILEIAPTTKSEGLDEFASRGYLLVDATYSRVNHDHLSRRERNNMILADFPILSGDLRKHAEAYTRIILVKANICEQLEPPLSSSGFAVLNRGQKVLFPSTGNQNRFRIAVRPLLGL